MQKRKNSGMVVEETGPKTRSKASKEVKSSGSTSFPSLGDLPGHTLSQSRKRAIYVDNNPFKGDRLLTESHLKGFKPALLSDHSQQKFGKLFGQADAQRKNLFSTSSTFAKSKVKQNEDGMFEHQVFAVLDQTKGNLFGRTVVPPEPAGKTKFDNASHAIPLSAVVNQYAVNKTDMVFAEHMIANQGGVRAIEEFGRDMASEHGIGNVAMVTRWRSAEFDGRPSQVERAVLVRNKNGIGIVGGYSHDNDSES